MQIYRYSRSIMNVRVAVLLVWVLGVVAPVAWILWPYDRVEEVDLMGAIGFYTLFPCLYYGYLATVARTAIFTLDADSIGYHDAFVRTAIKWEDLVELTPSRLRASNGRTIFLKLLLSGVEDWESFQQTVVERARLAPVRRKGNRVVRWERSSLVGQEA